MAYDKAFVGSRHPLIDGSRAHHRDGWRGRRWGRRGSRSRQKVWLGRIERQSNTLELGEEDYYKYMNDHPQCMSTGNIWDL